MSKKETMIRLEGIKKRFRTKAGELEVLHGVSADIKKGEVFGIIGLSGAGKSTLVRCINLLERPTAGKVWLDGVELTALGDKELREQRRHMGMIFQQFHLLMQRTALDNVCFPMEISGVPKAKAKERAKELLELVGLADRMESYPAQLSGGQKQRVAIARGHMADGLSVQSTNADGRKNGVATVGWKNNYHAQNARRLNDGTKKYRADHFVTNVQNDSTVQKKVLLAEKAEYEKLIRRKGGK